MSEKKNLKYLDTNLNNIISQNESKENVNIFDVIEKIIPEWIIKRTYFYVEKYSTLQTNWKNLCSQWKTTPKEIILVEYLPDIDKFEHYTTLRHIIDTLTFNGYVVRNIADITTCKRCNGAMLSEIAYNFMKEKSSLPMWNKEWSDTCDGCL